MTAFKSKLELGEVDFKLAHDHRTRWVLLKTTIHDFLQQGKPLGESFVCF
jgi:hypothetical protein